MGANPHDYGERCRFDAFYKTVLKHEAIDYIWEMKRRANRETSLERLPQTAMDERILRIIASMTAMCSRTAATACRSAANRLLTPLLVCRSRSKAF